MNNSLYEPTYIEVVKLKLGQAVVQGLLNDVGLVLTAQVRCASSAVEESVRVPQLGRLPVVSE